MADFPYYDFSAKKIITDPKEANDVLNKYMKP